MSIEALNRVCVNSSDEIIKFFDGQEDKPFVIPSLVLSEDNKRVLNANIIARGRILKDKPRNFDGMKLWELERPLNVKFSDINLGVFGFNGELCSDLVDAKTLGNDGNFLFNNL